MGAFKLDDIYFFEILKRKSKLQCTSLLGKKPKPYVSMIYSALYHYFTALDMSERKMDGFGLPFVVKSRLLFILSILELCVRLWLLRNNHEG
jgi:hypothetical protein